MNYPESAAFLYSLGNELKTAKFGLERITRLMRELGDPQKKPARFVHVAGTNGKGSTCAMIESGLRAEGCKTGLFTSPHLTEPTERIRIDGGPVSAPAFTRAFEEAHEAAERLLLAGEIDFHPTYFETVTAMGFLIFRDERVDVAVMETGMGGRLDATNVVEPELTVITPIDFDHEKFLGSGIEAIAGEKAGILKRGVPAVMSRQRAEAAEVIRRVAEEVEAPLREAPEASESEVFREGSRLEWGNYRIECRLRGRHQVANAMTALAALDALRVSREAVESGIRTARWPGRLEVIRQKPEVIVDGAHNPAGARALAEYVAEFYSDPKPVLIFGAMRDKAVEEMADALFRHFNRVIVTSPDQSRALQPETLAGLTDHPDVTIEPNLKSALSAVRGRDRTVFVSGSLFLVGEAMRLTAQ